MIMLLAIFFISLPLRPSFAIQRAMPSIKLNIGKSQQNHGLFCQRYLNIRLQKSLTFKSLTVTCLICFLLEEHKVLV